MTFFDIFKKKAKVRSFNEELYAAVNALEKNEIIMIPKEEVKVSAPMQAR